MNYQNKKRAIGIFGGTFDPIHIGHLLAAENVYSTLRLDEVWFMPTYISPHKQNRQVTNSQHRVEMLKRALAPYPEFQVCTYEIEQATVSYTYNTIVHLINSYPEFTFHFIIGADMVQFLPQWYRFEDLLRIVSFAAVMRPNHNIDFTNDYCKQIQFVEMPQCDISSSDIRRRILEGKSIRFMVPKEVEDYIKEQRLYVDNR